MKKLILITIGIVLFEFNVFCQKENPKLPFDSLTNKITYSEAVFVDSLTNKQELFSRTREWFAKTYKSSTNVIQMEDKENGKIVGKALMQVYHKGLFSELYESGYINYTISIYIKDGRYKYEITDFYHKGQYIGGKYNGRIPDYGVCENMINTKDKTMGISNQKFYNYYLYQIDTNIKNLIIDLKTTISSKNKKDEW